MSSNSTFSYAQAAKGLQGTPISSNTASEPEKAEPQVEEQSNGVIAEPVPAASESETPQDTEKSVDEPKEAEFTTVTSKARSKGVNSRTSSPSVNNRSNAQPRDGDSSSTPNGNSEASSEKKAQADGKADKSEDGSEGSKDKSDKSEKSDKSVKSDKSEKDEKSEKNTPPKELKAAPLPSVNIWHQRKEAQDARSKTAPATSATTGKTTEIQQDSSKANPKKKGADGATDGVKGGKKTEGGKALPAVGDATAWPTPEVALGEEKKKAQEKTDKSPVIRPHGKEKWMPVNYVPTAVFNTPLPTAGGGGGGGRGGRRATRGGRDGGRGAAHGAGAAGEKAASGQAAQGTAKQAAGERGRTEANSGRAASLPAQARRSDSAEAPAEGRKAQAAERGRAPRGAEDAAASNGKQTNGENTRPQRDGKQFAKHQEARNSRAANLAVDPHATARVNERRAESGSKSADPAGFHEFNRERGGRSNRGRGPYGSFGGQNGQFGNMPNNFGNPKFGGFNDRQRSQNGVPNGSQQGNRMPLRSPSLPVSASPYGYYPNDMNVYGYQAVAPGPMSAVPYQQYMEPFSLMPMLSMQLEYYFSVDNLCKDMFLRRHMDGQGFVPLGVIAGFKRVKSLTEDFELLRHVSRGLRNVEYQVGEDGLDRLRSREKWAQWVFPVDQRDPSAQHDGVAPKNYENVPFNHHAESVPNGFNVTREFIPNGTGSRGSQTLLSSTAPEFMPSMPPTQSQIANVGDPEDFYYPYPLEGSLTKANSSFDPFGKTFINDDSPARRLKSHQPKTLSLCSWMAEQPTGFSAENIHRRASSDVTFDSSPLSPNAPLFTPRKPDSRYHKKSVHTRNSFDIFRNTAFGAQDPRVTPPSHGLSIGPPYRFWSQHLTRNFNLQLYNEFRRLAIDDLFTRHNNYGINALTSFYHTCLISRRPLPDEVICDMVHLSHAPFKNCHSVLNNLLNLTMSTGAMENDNRVKASYYFGLEYGPDKRRWKEHRRSR
ncbi:Winged helix-turn-helix transcription repressor DNA-binding [Penicillium atrosanguineum]|uniref:Winged helix-turn-helix transcription repressor DNA-binding n=1 Tax=Penicillium atrosanguineum TaxID=1132637 RepID=A0A9W9PSY5_9EURO|nr:Winged helix-turn-helix transcription repressor DNA-binding [Penicillium atrosanguineum]